MKRVLVLGVAVLTMLALASGVMAQAPAKTDKPAATAPEKAAAAAEKAKPAVEKAKPKAPKAMKYAGTVAAYEAGKRISVKDAKGKEMTFDVSADAKLKGEIKDGAKVNVLYKKDGDKMVATSISGTSPKPKKEAPKKKEASKK